MTEIPTIGGAPVYDPSATATFGNSKLEKDDFLNLLVTQLRYQNPLEPLKDSDFVAQLAQFSSLEQLENINSSLGYSTELDYILSQTIANTMATTIIGKEVVADGNTIYHSYDSEDDLHFKLDADASDIEINIYNDSGALIRTIRIEDLEEGMNSCNWDGNDDSGTKVAGGQYTFSVSATDNAGNVVGAQTRIVGIVESVRYEDNQGYLIIGRQRISMSDIIQINLPDDSGGDSDDGQDDYS
jgi:flagellar basal-body rod modification protein FlgD